MKTDFRVVPDTNVIISAQSNNPTIPNRELMNRWLDDEFVLLYSLDTLQEYFEKLQELEFSEELIIELLVTIRTLAENVTMNIIIFVRFNIPKIETTLRLYSVPTMAMQRIW